MHEKRQLLFPKSRLSLISYQIDVSLSLRLIFRYIHMLHRARRAVLVEEYAAVSDGALGLAGIAF